MPLITAKEATKNTIIQALPMSKVNDIAESLAQDLFDNQKLVNALNDGKIVKINNAVRCATGKNKTFCDVKLGLHCKYSCITISAYGKIYSEHELIWQYLKPMLENTTVPSIDQFWRKPRMQRCYVLVPSAFIKEFDRLLTDYWISELMKRGFECTRLYNNTGRYIQIKWLAHLDPR